MRYDKTLDDYKALAGNVHFELQNELRERYGRYEAQRARRQAEVAVTVQVQTEEGAANLANLVVPSGSETTETLALLGDL